jgi:hypothetical protein
MGILPAIPKACDKRRGTIFHFDRMLITHSGARHEFPLGIVTRWDLIGLFADQHPVPNHRLECYYRPNP